MLELGLLRTGLRQRLLQRLDLLGERALEVAGRLPQLLDAALGLEGLHLLPGLLHLGLERLLLRLERLARLLELGLSRAGSVLHVARGLLHLRLELAVLDLELELLLLELDAPGIEAHLLLAALGLGGVALGAQSRHLVREPLLVGASLEFERAPLEVDLLLAELAPLLVEGPPLGGERRVLGIGRVKGKAGAGGPDGTTQGRQGHEGPHVTRSDHADRAGDDRPSRDRPGRDRRRIGRGGRRARGHHGRLGHRARLRAGREDGEPDHRGGGEAESDGSGEARQRSGHQDLLQSGFEVLHGTGARGAGGERVDLAGNEGEALEQAARVRVGRGRQHAQHPLVAAPLLRAAQGTARPPRDGVPPEQSGGGDLDEADPVVAPAHVSQLVGEEGVALVGREPGQERPWQEEQRAAARGPQHRGHCRGNEENGWRGGQPEARRDLRRASADGFRGRGGGREQAAEASRAPEGDRSDDQRPEREQASHGRGRVLERQRGGRGGPRRGPVQIRRPGREDPGSRGAGSGERGGGGRHGPGPNESRHGRGWRRQERAPRGQHRHRHEGRGHELHQGEEPEPVHDGLAFQGPARHPREERERPRRERVRGDERQERAHREVLSRERRSTSWRRSRNSSADRRPALTRCVRSGVSDPSHSCSAVSRRRRATRSSRPMRAR